MAFSIESSGQQLDKTLLTIVLNNCAVTLTFMVKHAVPGVGWMYSYIIYKEILWVYEIREKILHILSVFKTLSFPKRI